MSLLNCEPTFLVHVISLCFQHIPSCHFKFDLREASFERHFQSDIPFMRFFRSTRAVIRKWLGVSLWFSGFVSGWHIKETCFDLIIVQLTFIWLSGVIDCLYLRCLFFYRIRNHAMSWRAKCLFFERSNWGSWLVSVDHQRVIVFSLSSFTLIFRVNGWCVWSFLLSQNFMYDMKKRILLYF